MYKVVLALPTSSGKEKIEKWILNIKKELPTLPDNFFQVNILIGLNGKNTVFASDQNFIQLCAHENIEIFISNTNGKNNCINEMVKHCKSLKYDIIHFFDDDIFPESNAIKINLETLVKYSKVPILVGSNFYVKKEGLSVLQKILYAPYQIDSDYNDFVAGYSNCTWLSYYPILPSTNTQIAEDSYINIYFAQLGDSTNSIIKPRNSIVYFEAYNSYKDWFWTQVRTYVGIEFSFLIFGTDYFKFQNLFSWRYAEDKRFRVKKRKLGFFPFIKLIFFRMFQHRVYKEGQKVLLKSEEMEWNNNAKN